MKKLICIGFAFCMALPFWVMTAVSAGTTMHIINEQSTPLSLGSIKCKVLQFGGYSWLPITKGAAITVPAYSEYRLAGGFNAAGCSVINGSYPIKSSLLKKKSHQNITPGACNAWIFHKDGSQTAVPCANTCALQRNWSPAGNGFYQCAPTTMCFPSSDGIALERHHHILSQHLFHCPTNLQAVNPPNCRTCFVVNDN